MKSKFVQYFDLLRGEDAFVYNNAYLTTFICHSCRCTDLYLKTNDKIFNNEEDSL